MIIDIHNHADYHGCSVRDMLSNMDTYGIDVTCLLSWEAPVTDYDPATKYAFSPLSDMPVPFERCLYYRDAAPDRFLLGFCPDPRRPDAISRLRAAVKLFDISLCGELKLRMMYDNPDALRMYRACAEYALPVLVHLDYEIPNGQKHPWPNYWYGGGIEALARALAACPETLFIGHAPGFWAHISNDEQYKTVSYPQGPVVPGGRIEQLLEKYPNLYCDISAGSGCRALARDTEFTRGFLARWHDRVLFGRDYFDNKHQELLNSMQLPASVLYDIYEGNARRILRGGDKIRRR